MVFWSLLVKLSCENCDKRERERIDFVNEFGANAVADYHEQTIHTLCNDTVEVVFTTWVTNKR